MGRGNIYYITKDKDADFCFTERNYYDHLEAYRIDHADDQSEEESRIPLGYLRNELQKLGAAIDIPSGIGDIDREFDFSFNFDSINQAQQAYFRPKLKYLKKQVEDLSLFQVIRSAPALDFILDNNNGDLITFNDGEFESTISFDDLIRRMKSGVTYYVYKRVILIH